jgi:hypothetical protein
VAGASVSVSSPVRSGDEAFDSATTDEQGRFTLAVVAGRRYLVSAHHYVGQRGEDGTRAPVTYKADSELPIAADEEIRLTLKRTAP